MLQFFLSQELLRERITSLYILIRQNRLYKRYKLQPLSLKSSEWRAWKYQRLLSQTLKQSLFLRLYGHLYENVVEV